MRARRKAARKESKYIQTTKKENFLSCWIGHNCPSSGFEMLSSHQLEVAIEASDVRLRLGYFSSSRNSVVIRVFASGERVKGELAGIISRVELLAMKAADKQL